MWYIPLFLPLFGGGSAAESAARDGKKWGKSGVKYPLIYPLIYPICPAAVLVDINAHGGEQSETMKRAISAAALPLRRFVRPAAPARAVRPAGFSRSLCAPRSGLVCAPKARRFCALRAPILGTMCPDCAPCGRAICPPSAGEGTKNPRSICEGLFVRAGRSTQRSQKRALNPARLPANRFLILVYSPSVATNSNLCILAV